MKTSYYKIKTEKKISPLRIAVVADFHNSDPESVFDACVNAAPDAVFIPGDLFSRVCFEKNDGEYGEYRAANENGFQLLAKLAGRYPVFFSVGNHEKSVSGDCGDEIRSTGTEILDDSFVSFGDFLIGGLTSAYGAEPESDGKKRPDIAFLDAFSRENGVKLLLCHHPEYYPLYVRDRDIDVTFSGHAHGGQWRFFGQGIYSPGQGLFPKYTSGVYENRLVVSRGIGNLCGIPRINNAPETVVVDLC